MEFKTFRDSQEPPTPGEIIVWDWLKAEFDDDPENGSAFEQWPFYATNQNRYRPDILVIHPQYGVNVFSIKDLRIENVENINGNYWYYSDWYEEKSDPLMNAERAMFSVRDRIKKKLDLKNNLSINIKDIAFNNLFLLPFISETDFQKKFPVEAQELRRYLIFKEAFEGTNNMPSIFNQFINRMQTITTQQFKEIRQTIDVMGEHSPNIDRRTKPESKGSLLDMLNDEINNLDYRQHNSAANIPNGPQRIRGLAGTGKTVIIAMKAAMMYKHKPEWKILITFGTKSLYDTLYNFIDYFINKALPDEVLEGENKIDWKDRISLLPSWGSQSKNEPGVYSTICQGLNYQFQTVGSIKRKYGGVSNAFDLAVRDLLEEKQDQIKEDFDAILIDEGQDLPTVFYTLCMKLLKAPKRLIIGWDDMQDLGRLDIRDAKTLLGYQSDGTAYSFSGEYPGGISKDTVLQFCYRSPRQVIFLAHMFGLGFKRAAGFLQFIDDPQAWRDIGYNIDPDTNDILEKGDVVRIKRGLGTSGNNLESYNEVSVDNIITKSTHENREGEVKYISERIKELVENDELKPEEIAIVSIDAKEKTIQQYATLFRQYLPEKIKLLDGAVCPRMNKLKNHIYLGSTYRAKGNQYGYVFVVSIELTQSDNEYSSVDVRRRNNAFSAMTRTKAWLHISGVGKKADLIMEEISTICSDLNSCEIAIQVPDKNRLRALDTEEHRKVRKANIEARFKKEGGFLDLLNKDPAVLAQILELMDPDKQAVAREVIEKMRNS